MMLLLILHSDNMLTLLGARQEQNGSFVDFLTSQFKTRVLADGEIWIKITWTNIKANLKTHKAA